MLRAIDGLPLTKHHLDIYRQCTGRTGYREKPCREGCVLCGARGGKTGRVATTHGAHKAAFGDHERYLSRGERATFPLIAQDFKAGRVAFGYFSDYFSNSPLLKSMLADDPLSNEQTSTPFLKDGIMYSDYQNHWGVDDSPVLVWKASSLMMNPSLGLEQLEAQRELDPTRYSREFEAEFIDAFSCFIPAAWIESAVRRGRHDNPPIAGISYVKAIDQSQLRGDRFTLSIGHKEGDKVIFDLVRGWTGNGSEQVDLEGTVKEIVAIGKRYGSPHFIGDQQAKDWVEQEFRRAGASFTQSERDTSTCYLESEPFFATGNVEIPDDPTLIREVKLLERNARPGGKTMVTHPRGNHDDFATAVCRVIANIGGGAFDVRDLQLVGRERMTRRSDFWNEDPTGAGSVIEQLYDTGQLSSRNRWNWQLTGRKDGEEKMRTTTEIKSAIAAVEANVEKWQSDKEKQVETRQSLNAIREKFAYSARMGDADAKKKIEKATTESKTLEAEIENIDYAIAGADAEIEKLNAEHEAAHRVELSLEFEKISELLKDQSTFLSGSISGLAASFAEHGATLRKRRVKK